MDPAQTQVRWRSEQLRLGSSLYVNFFLYLFFLSFDNVAYGGVGRGSGRDAVVGYCREKVKCASHG